MRLKLGLFGEESEDEMLIDGLLDIMVKHKLDYHLTFIDLTLNVDQLEHRPEFSDWLTKYRLRRSVRKTTLDDSVLLMKSVNPAMIPRNHRVEEALSHAVEHNDLSKFNELLAMLQEPFKYSTQQLQSNQPAPASSFQYKTYCGT